MRYREERAKFESELRTANNKIIARLDYEVTKEEPDMERIVKLTEALNNSLNGYANVSGHYKDKRYDNHKCEHEHEHKYAVIEVFKALSPIIQTGIMSATTYFALKSMLKFDETDIVDKNAFNLASKLIKF